jgi:hypothetical protein
MNDHRSDSSVSSAQSVPLDWVKNALCNRFGAVQQVETVKLRPWSQVYRVVAERGISYFKICGPDAQQEVSLFEWLLPDHLAILPEIIALEPEQGWIFMADAGIPLRDLPQPENHRQRLQSLLSSYARLQQRSLNYIDNLLEMSLPDRSLERIPHLLQDLVKTGSNNGWIDAVLRNQVLETMTTLEQLCNRLSASPYAAALDHGDLHTGNVLFSHGKLSICDWGDACITHPFCSLLPLVVASLGQQFASVVEVVETSLVRKYLQNWSSFASIDSLKAEARLALCLGLVLRAMDMAYMLQSADEESVNRWSPFVSKCLAQWVQLEATIPRTNLE